MQRAHRNGMVTCCAAASVLVVAWLLLFWVPTGNSVLHVFGLLMGHAQPLTLG